MRHLVSFRGRLGRDPVLRISKNGNHYATFSLATGSKKGAPPLWRNIVVFGELAEICAAFYKKGQLVSVTGVTEPDTYRKNNKEENNTPAFEQNIVIKANDVILVAA